MVSIYMQIVDAIFERLSGCNLIFKFKRFMINFFFPLRKFITIKKGFRYEFRIFSNVYKIKNNDDDIYFLI